MDTRVLLAVIFFFFFLIGSFSTFLLAFTSILKILAEMMVCLLSLPVIFKKNKTESLR